MPGYDISMDIFKNSRILNDYLCSECQLLLKDPVQPACGHRLCESCAEDILQRHTTPCCPECDELFDKEDGACYFSDRFVKREINKLEVRCEFCNRGCNWTGQFQQYQRHIGGCKFQDPCNVQPFTCTASPTHSLNILQPPDIQCRNCSAFIRCCEFAAHQERCLVLLCGRQCPLLALGCPNECYMDQSELDKHLQECQYNHLALLASRIQRLMQRVENVIATFLTLHSAVDASMNSQRIPDPRALFENRSHSPLQNDIMNIRSIYELLKTKDTEIEFLCARVAMLEKTVHLKNTELEDRDFQLSLVENSNHDGSIIWKISQFSQRRDDAQSGKCTSIFSLPFYSGRYGYKMCLYLYIMGGGIGKGTHAPLTVLCDDAWRV